MKIKQKNILSIINVTFDLNVKQLCNNKFVFKVVFN